MNPAAAADTAAFAPPPTFAFEPELRGPAPRPLPAAVKTGRWQAGRRCGAAGLLLAGALCLLLSRLPFSQRLGDTIPLCQRLDWLAAALLALGLAAALAARFWPGRFRYVTQGCPLPARVKAVSLEPALRVNGQDAKFAFRAEIEVADPTTGLPGTHVVKSREFGASHKDSLECPLRPGQWVTAVHLPGQFPASLRLYGFLDLNPEVNFLGGPPPGTALAGLRPFLGAFGLLFLLLWLLFVYRTYPPWRLTPAMLLACLPGAAALGGGMLAFLTRLDRRHPAACGLRNRVPGGGGLKKTALASGALLFGGFVSFGGLLAVNAAGVTVPGTRHRVELLGVQSRSYAFLYRGASVEFRQPDSGRRRRVAIAFAELPRFAPAAAAAEVEVEVEVVAGRLGWPWIRRVVPAAGRDAGR